MQLIHQVGDTYKTPKNPTGYSRTSATARAVYLPKANTEGGAAGYNRGRAPRHRE